MKLRALIGVLALAAGMLTVLTGPASAAPTRYEAENATISQGVVESNHTGFSGTGFVNGDNVAGSYTEWTVNAATAGTATIAIRYSNGTTVDRPGDVAVNGNVVSAARSFPSTTNWDTWVTSTLTAPVNAGSNKIRITATTANGNPNLDFVDVEVSSTVTTQYQAENATISQGVVATNHTGYTGTGFVDYVNTVGSYIEWNVSAPVAGSATLAFRYANGTTADRPMDITVNGATTNKSFPVTTNWDTWATVSLTANLSVGNNIVRATATTANGGPNADRLDVTTGTSSDTEKPTAPGQPTCDDNNNTDTTIPLDWPPSTDNVGVVAYDIYNLGQQIATAPAPPYTVTGLNASSTYTISVFARDAAGNVSLSSPEVVCHTKAPTGDTPPTKPGTPAISNVTATGATATWTASTDDHGVASYKVRNHATGTVLASVPGTTASVPLECNTTYTLDVVAVDTISQNSAPSDPSNSFTTPSCGTVPQSPTTVAGSWDVPWDIAWAPDASQALVTERDTFKVFKVSPTGTKTQVGTVPNVVTTDGEGGLMGVQFSPTWNGTTDQQVFFMHTASEGNRVATMNYNGTSLSGYSAILTGINKNRYHNGGRIRFGPDHYLYVTTGDAQQSSNAPNLSSLNGKILRITKTGAAAPGNPFGTRVWSYGHRNPQGITWDSAGRMWESELGNSAFDELNLIQPGKNYGWPTCEGNCSTSGMTNPKYQWDVSVASPSGIDYVNGALFMAALRGQRLWRIVLNGENVSSVNSYFNSTYGRLRAVTKVPGASAIWFGSTNSDNNGNGNPDVIRRSNIQ
ncbi:PQQ-dependent sugar dehydrogenase [Nonomuraea sediminis]|uniref:PQQ-dependent sugar dehydrogenase n=1 Tax=Nonomuraea sediminis TaxID=2835864 RepID=UPI001BDBC630|nr:PQQ-dependent sugar dehydrogenase [Nonomuraea sediminis]